MTHIVVLATGGTISSRKRHDGAAVATDSAEALVRAADAGRQVTVEPIDLLRENSFNLSLGDLRRIAEGVRAQLARPEVDGIVVTHGTDTVEETSMLLDLVHADERPVVLTGAQLSPDDEAHDGPRNLREAIAVAAAPGSRGAGVLVSFAGRIFAAAGIRKGATTAAQPFVAPTGHIGSVVAGRVTFHTRPVREEVLPAPTEAFDATRVDILVAYPGATPDLFDASVAAGAAGIVLAGTGTGNLNRGFVDAIRAATDAGTVVALSTRVADGPVVPVYGDGGAVDVLAAGAVPVTWLPYSQARVLLALLLSHYPSGEAASRLRRY